MELQYVQALREHNLSINELPEDAKTGIADIKNITKAIDMLGKKGIQPKESSIKKLKAIDKWVYYEILDYINDKSSNDEEAPYEAEEIIEELEEQEEEFQEEEQEDMEFGDTNTGVEIEKEAIALLKFKNSWTVDELRGQAPTMYQTLFDIYDDDEDNGIVTSNFTIMEQNDGTFLINKK